MSQTSDPLGNWLLHPIKLCTFRSGEEQQLHEREEERELHGEKKKKKTAAVEEEEPGTQLRSSPIKIKTLKLHLRAESSLYSLDETSGVEIRDLSHHHKKG